MARKNYIVAPYSNTWAMYESNDFRLLNLSPQFKGTFSKTDKHKGRVNGYEIGEFVTDSGDKFVIFTDHSAIKIL